MRLHVLLLALACCAGAINAAPPAFQSVNLPAGISGQKILSTPDGGFLVLATSQVLRYSAAGALISTWTAPGSLAGFTLDAQGNLYVVGTATGNVPIVNSSVPAGSGAKSFFMKLDSSYSNVLVSGLFGDSSTRAAAIAVDASGNIYFGGSTLAAAFPNAFNPSPPPVAGQVAPTYAFAIKLSATAEGIVYSALLGGATFRCYGGGYCEGVEGPEPPPKSAFSGVAAIAVDANGALTLAGSTFSDGFPVTPGVIDGVSVGLCEYDECSLSGFVAKLDPTGSVLIYSTCFGINYIGTGAPISALRLTPDGNAVIAGRVFGGLGPTAPLAGENIFLATLNASGTAIVSELVYPPVYGSPLVVSVNDFTIDSSGNTWITGGEYVAEVPPDDSGIVSLGTFSGGAFGLSITAFGSGVLVLGANSVVYVSAPTPTSAVSGGVFNAISQQPESSVAPGEFVTVYGSNLNGASVDFNGVSAPLLYSGPNQINAIALWNLGGPMNVRVDGVLVKSIPVGAATANLQLLALVNADGTINSTTNPAPAGSIVTAYINGASYGPVQSQFPNGSLSTMIISLSPQLSSSAGLAITYQGSAPGLLNEVQQVNLRVTGQPPGLRATLSQGSSVLTFHLAVSPN